VCIFRPGAAVMSRRYKCQPATSTYTSRPAHVTCDHEHVLFPAHDCITTDTSHGNPMRVIRLQCSTAGLGAPMALASSSYGDLAPALGATRRARSSQPSTTAATCGSGSARRLAGRQHAHTHAASRRGAKCWPQMAPQPLPTTQQRPGGSGLRVSIQPHAPSLPRERAGGAITLRLATARGARPAPTHT
jgi:hypothetical protein